MPQPSFKIGLNYQEDKSRSISGFRAASKAYFKSIKRPDAPIPIRIMVKAQPYSIPYPFALGTDNGVDNFAYHHNLMLEFAADPDFDVIFNVLAGPMTFDSFNQMRQSILTYAQLLKDLNVNVELSIGNELADTYGIQYGISSCTRSGTVATIVPVSPFKTHVGDTITLWGMSSSAWNGSYTVTSTTGDRTFTIDVPSTNSASASGNVYSMGVVDLNNALRQLGTDIHAVNPNQKVSCGEYGRTVNGVNNLDDWNANGVGGLDYMSLHIYPGLYRSSVPSPELNCYNALFPKTYVSEFNLDSGSISGTQYSKERGVNAMRSLYKTFNGMAVSRATIWSWDTNLNMHNTDGSFHPMWFVFTTNNGRMPLMMYNKTRTAVTGRASVTRSAAPARALV